jgi:hypothetical protein
MVEISRGSYQGISRNHRFGQESASHFCIEFDLIDLMRGKKKKKKKKKSFPHLFKSKMYVQLW